MSDWPYHHCYYGKSLTIEHNIHYRNQTHTQLMLCTETHIWRLRIFSLWRHFKQRNDPSQQQTSMYTWTLRFNQLVTSHLNSLRHWWRLGVWTWLAELCLASPFLKVNRMLQGQQVLSAWQQHGIVPDWSTHQHTFHCSPTTNRDVYGNAVITQFWIRLK